MPDFVKDGSNGPAGDLPQGSSDVPQKPIKAGQKTVFSESSVSAIRRAMRLRTQQNKEYGDEKYSLRRRRISDRVFGSIESAHQKLNSLLDEQHQEYAWLRKDLSVPVDIVEDKGALPVLISPIAAASLATAAHMAFDWKTIFRDKEEEKLLEILQARLQEMSSVESVGALVQKHPHWDGILQVLAADAMSGGEYVRIVEEGIDDEILENDSDFTVEARVNPAEQIQAIAAGIVLRLKELYSHERLEGKQELEGWDRWEHDVRPAKLEDKKKRLEIIYKDVIIHPKLLCALLSPKASIRNAAIDTIRNQGGFLKMPNENEMTEMIQYGIAAVLDDDAYYGVLTDPRHIEQHMIDLCGYDPTKEYRTIDDLPTESKVGPVQWVKKRSALEMFQNMDQVALTMELAVKKTPGKSGKARRNAGIAAALKNFVHRRVQQSMIFTRHFEILEVDGHPVEMVENFGSMRGIQTLGGQYIGSVEETFDVPGILPGQTIRLRVMWHFSLTDRQYLLEVLDKKRKKK